MRLVCSYCRHVIRADPGSRITDVSHGMCDACAQHFERLWSGMPVEEYLDALASPVLVVDRDTRVITMNQRFADLFGIERESVVGLTGGEALACARSRLPEGCGRTVHCRECAVRRTVEEVARTGQVREGMSAYILTDLGRVPLRISGRPGHAGTVQVTIEALGEPRPGRGEGRSLPAREEDA